jgi:hypothetical protein
MQALYHLSHAASLFALLVMEIGSFAQAGLTYNFSILGSFCGGMIGVHHRVQLLFVDMGVP